MRGAVGDGVASSRHRVTTWARPRGLDDARRREQCKHVAQCDVQRRVGDPQAGRPAHLIARSQVEHHGHFVHAAQIGQQFRVAGIGVPGSGQRRLVQRRRHHAVHTLRLGQLTSHCHGFVGGLAASGMHLGRRQVDHAVVTRSAGTAVRCAEDRPPRPLPLPPPARTPAPAAARGA